MFNYHLLPSHITWLYRDLRSGRPVELDEFYASIWDIHKNLPGQGYHLDIFDDEYEPLYNLVKNEPIFGELARELEIEMS